MKDKLLKYVEEINEPFQQAAQDIWENPELGMQEFYAADRLVKLLEDNGFSVEKGAAGLPTAFVAEYGEGRPVIGFSAEFDALPGLSQRNDVTVKEPVVPMGPGHGCGHNLLSTGGMQAAVALKKLMEEKHLKGTLKVFGTPAEEICIGKPFMARAGLFEGLDAVVDWHPGAANFTHSSRNNAYFNVKYYFTGKAAHGNAPWRGVSALDSAMLMGHSLEIIREHIEPGAEGSESTLNYAFPDCGNAYPVVVPDRAAIWVVGRFETAEICSSVIAKVRKAAEGCALATGTTVEEEFITATHEMIPNRVISEKMNENFRYIGPPPADEEDQETIKAIQRELGYDDTGFSGVIEEVREAHIPVTDSSEYSWNAPLGIAQAAIVPQLEMAGHNWMMTRMAGSSAGMKARATAAKLLAITAYDLLTDEKLLADAREEWQQRMGGRTYQTLIPEGVEPDPDTNKDIMEKFRR